MHWLVHIAAGRHGLLSDAPEAEGGGAKGPGPFTYVLAGLVACTSGTLRMQHVDVNARVVQGPDGTPEIEREIHIVGDLDDDRQQLAQVVERTPVTRALRAGADPDRDVRPRQDVPLRTSSGARRSTTASSR